MSKVIENLTKIRSDNYPNFPEYRLEPVFCRQSDQTLRQYLNPLQKTALPPTNDNKIKLTFFLLFFVFFEQDFLKTLTL